nr:MAG TPA: hypothetical protein [Caudoviricetes sp.]
MSKYKIINLLMNMHLQKVLMQPKVLENTA